MSNTIANFIIRRQDEEISELEQVLDMFTVQRNVSMDDFCVTIVHSSKEQYDYSGLQAKYPFRIEIIEKETDSLSAAYNEAIRASEADWLMFMEYGDRMCDLYSVSMILNLLPTDEYDILWTAYYDEFKRKNANYVNVATEATPSLTGKMFRNEFLIRNGIRFDESVTQDEGTVFLATAKCETDYQRFAKISTRFVPYLHIEKPFTDEVTPEDIILRRHRANMAVIRNSKGRKNTDLYAQYVMKAMCNAYFFLHTDGIDNAAVEILEDTENVYADNAWIIDRMRPQDEEVFLDEAEHELLSMIQNAYQIYGHEMYYDADDEPYEMWMRRFRGEQKETPKPSVKRETSQSTEEKVAVFCGTRNVYKEMETAAKSLMCHTKMDRIYFFIEDDEFPEPLPENCICRNVSGQKWFDPKGKNYKSTWTYMCLMRAAFAKLMPDEHKVLSLDIDVIVNEDVSELWDYDLDGYYFAGVPETDMTDKQKTTYCNFGVIMMNLDLIRESGMDDRIIESLNRDKWRCPEQDAFNHFCAGKIFELPSMYNATRTSAITERPDVEKISHYAGIRYWKHYKPYRQYEQMTWGEILRTQQTEAG